MVAFSSDTVNLCRRVPHIKHEVKTWPRDPSSQIAKSSPTFRSGPYLHRLLAELDRAAICRRIAQAREEAGLTQPELADALDPPVHFRTVQTWETGQKDKKGVQRWPVPFDRLDEIARITGVTKDWLLHGEEQPDAKALRDQEIRGLRAEVAGLREMLEELLRRSTA